MKPIATDRPTLNDWLYTKLIRSKTPLICGKHKITLEDVIFWVEGFGENTLRIPVVDRTFYITKSQLYFQLPPDQYPIYSDTGDLVFQEASDELVDELLNNEIKIDPAMIVEQIEKLNLGVDETLFVNGHAITMRNTVPVVDGCPINVATSQLLEEIAPWLSPEV